MTKTEYKKHLIKIVHTLKSTNGINDDDYRFILNERFSVDSSLKLDIKALRELCLVLGYKGRFELKKDVLDEQNTDEISFHISFKRYNKNKNASAKQIFTILKMWQEKSRTKSYYALATFCDKIVKKQPFKLGYLSKDDATKLILALKNFK